MPKGKDGTWSADFTEEEARALTATAGQPVGSLPISYIWHTGPWFDLFDEQIRLISSDIQRARAEDKLIVYLSCPISSRGGGYAGANVDIAKHVERQLLSRWGEAFWILNPAQYQLESKAGTGLIDAHATRLKIDLKRLRTLSEPVGGDYMRMWTTVLATNGKLVGQREVGEKLVNTGQFFDAYYFIGPRDVQSFFLKDDRSLTEGIQAYFARKDATDPEFKEYYSVADVDWRPLGPRTDINRAQYVLRETWENRRLDFLRYYGLRASANFSLGAHDEWLIFAHLNRARRKATADAARFRIDGDVGEQIAGFFDGSQIDPASSEALVSRGYAQ